MKTVTPKYELAARKLSLTPCNKGELVDYIANALEKATKVGIQLNCISHHIIRDFISLKTKIDIGVNNLHLYRMNHFDLVADVAHRLNLPISRFAKCHMTLKQNNLILQPTANGAFDAFHMFIKSCSETLVKEQYLIWRSLGFDVGDKRNWPSVRLLEWIQDNKVDINLPISHHRPTQLRAIFQHLNMVIDQHEIVELNKKQLNRYINKEIEAFAFLDLVRPNHTKKENFKQVYRNLPEIQCSKECLPSKFRLPPLFYIKELKNQTKIGSADCTRRFTINDEGIVFTIDARSEDEVALKIERDVRSHLANRQMHPIRGKKDHYKIAWNPLVNVILDYFDKTPSIYQKLREIHAVIKQP